MTTEVRVPDLGDFKDVEVIDVLVKPGDRVALETPLITLETEKATMDVPSSAAGVVRSVALKKGDRVSKGSVVVTVEAEGEAAAPAKAQPAAQSPAPSAAPAAPEQPRDDKSFTETMVRPDKGVAPPPPKAPAATDEAATKPDRGSWDFDVVVLGAGPGGYTAAFRAADLGMKV